jgi:hypothetical protein
MRKGSIVSERSSRFLLCAGLMSGMAVLCLGQQTLYGGNEWLQFESPNTGWLVTVDPEDGSVTLIGKPPGVARLSGLAFDAAGTLWATSITGTESGTLRTSTLLKLDPRDGSILETIGPVLDGPAGLPIAIESISFQPGTGALYATRGIADLGHRGGDLYRVDPTTGVAALLADNNNAYQLGSTTFAPDGTLYQATALYPNQPGGSPKLQTLDPTTGAVRTSLATPRFYKALAVRDDGALFGASSVSNIASDVDDFFRIDPATGAATFLGQTGHNPIGSLAFGPSESAGPCVSDARTLCLNGGRFAVTLHWSKPSSESGDGTGVGLTDDSGYFWFFDPANIEVVVKVLDACGLPAQRYWVFAAGLTNVEATMSVRDSQTGSLRTYRNAQGAAFSPIQDTGAFATCP